jgi:hypothetical protein
MATGAGAKVQLTSGFFEKPISAVPTKKISD